MAGKMDCVCVVLWELQVDTNTSPVNCIKRLQVLEWSHFTNHLNIISYRQKKKNIPLIGLSSCEHWVKSLLSASVFISYDGNSMELTAYSQHGKNIYEEEI